jgi:hypothetical protein
MEGPMKNRSGFALLALVAALLMADIVIRLAAPAAAQGPGSPQLAMPAVHLVGICNDSSYDTVIYRAWSNGVVEERDVHPSQPPRWQGWRPLLP